MRKNTLFHHKKYLQRTLNPSIHPSQSKDFLLQNPENSAKFCLLQISQEPQKIHNRTFNYIQTQHSRSYSTQFFNNKQIRLEGRFESPQNQNAFKRNHLIKEQIQQSVAMKSTFSNQMRKTHHSTFSYKIKDIPNSNSQENDRHESLISGKDSMRKLRKINYLPFTVEEQKEVENIDQIFKTAPSKQILAILNRTKITRQIRDNSQISREKSEEAMRNRKKSIFNIRHLMVKQKNQDDTKEFTNEYCLKRVLKKDSQQPKQLHSTNRNLIKMRLKNRYNKSSNSKR